MTFLPARVIAAMGYDSYFPGFFTAEEIVYALEIGLPSREVGQIMDLTQRCDVMGRQK